MRFVICLVGVLFTYVPTASGSECAYLSVPVGTNRTSDDVAENTIVIYQCVDYGKVFKTGNSVYGVKCQPNGEWNRLPHPCQTVRCGSQHLIHNSVVSTTSTVADVDVIYRCMYGFSFPDGGATKVVNCDETSLEWVPITDASFENMTCDTQYCEGLPANHSSLFYDGLEAYDINKTIPVGSVVTAYCNEGYMKGASTILSSGKCAASGRLDGSYDECAVRTCSNYPTPTRSTLIFNNNKYQKRRRYHCTSGRFPGGKDFHSMECDYNGQWKSEPSSSGCQVGGCEEGWVKLDDYCYFISDARSWGLRYYYAEESCIHKKAHLASITSVEEGLFLYSQTYELYEKDYWFGYHYDTVEGGWSWFDDSNTTYTKWHRGYPELSQSCARLTINGVWKDRDCDDLMNYICKKPTMCAAPPVILNGGPDVAVIPVTMDVGDSLTYKCDPGHTFRVDATSERVVTCLIGSYYSAIENCQPTKCPPLNRIGYYVVNAAIVGTQVNTVMNNITWTCNIGYIFPDGVFSKIVTCLPNRTWSYVPEQCIKIHCPVPGVLNAIPRNGSSAVGSADIYDCEVGYEFENGETERTMICQPDGKWITDDHCWKKECQPYFQYNANITGGESGVAKYKDRVEITCHVGYQFPGGSKVERTICGPDFHWTPYLPPCEPKICPGGTPPEVRNATANTTAGIINTIVLYTCISGYAFIDGDTERLAYCDLETQEWMDVPLECLSGGPDLSENTVGILPLISTITAAISITIIVIFMWAIVCSDCNEDRKLMEVCNGCGQSEDDDEGSEDGTESPEPEEIRVQMMV